MSLLLPIQRNLASSLLPSSLHDPKLLHLLSLPVSFEIIGYLATVTRSVIGEVIQPSLPTPPPESSSMHLISRDSCLPELEDFIYCVCSRSKVQVPTLVCTIIFLNRLRTKLPAKATGVPGTAHRLFLASLIAAAKYANDSSPRNKNWVRYAELFDLSEVNLMEKQLLFLLDFDLGFDELETIANVQPLLDLIYKRTLKGIRNSEIASPISPPAEGSDPQPQEDKAHVRGSAIEVVSRGSRQRVERQSRPDPVPISVPRVQYPPGLPVPVSTRILRQPPIQRPPKHKSAVALAPVVYTNVHMQSSSEALCDVLSRGPSTDSVNSSTSSHSNSSCDLTEDNGTSSSSSAAYSSDEYEHNNDDVGIVRVHAFLRPAADETDISSFPINDENLNHVDAGLAGIGTLVGKTAYGETVYPQRPQRSSLSVSLFRRGPQSHLHRTQPQIQVRGNVVEEQHHKSLRSRKTVRRSVVSTFLSSSDSEGVHQRGCGDHAHPQRSADSLLPVPSSYASSSSSVTTIIAQCHSNPHRYSTSQAQRYSVPMASATSASTPASSSARNLPSQAHIRPTDSRPATTLTTAEVQTEQSNSTAKLVCPSSLGRSFTSMGVPITSASASAACASRSGFGTGKTKPVGFGASLRSFLAGSVISVNDPSVPPPCDGGSRGRGAMQR